MCIYQQEVDALNRKLLPNRPLIDVIEGNPTKLEWWTQGCETLISLREGMWHLWDQGTEIETICPNLELGFTLHQMERDLEESIHKAGLKSKICMYYW